jgi:hypothetical protein
LGANPRGRFAEQRPQKSNTYYTTCLPRTVGGTTNPRRTTLEEIMAGHAVQMQFIKQLNRILGLDTFSETLSSVKKVFISIDRGRCSKASTWLLPFSRGR